jgi:hypothetical protein
VFFGLPDPDPLVRGMDQDPALDPDPDPSISMQKNKKNLESYYFVTLFDFLSLKNNVNVPSKSNKQKKLCYKNYFSAGILKVNDENSRIRIRIH